MLYDRWQAPDRDSPTTLDYEARVELGKQLDILLNSEGVRGTKEEEVKRATGADLSRPRRWHKIFERMGLLYPDATGITRLTELGEAIRGSARQGAREFRRSLARKAISVLRKYQLRNPADETGGDEYPPDTDLHPYWAIWKAAVLLDGKLHWDELNRVLMWVLKHQDLDPAIARIKEARKQPDYDPLKNGDSLLGPRAYDQAATTDDRDPSGQVRDQKTTPWFKRAGLGELLLSPAGRDGGGYWSVHPDLLDLLQAEVGAPSAAYVSYDDPQEWFAYYGKVDADQEAAPPETAIEAIDTLPLDLPDDDVVLKEVQEIIRGGSAGVLLSGPPGTSKTWYARRLAAKLVNGDVSRVRFVQFHPSMGYDDFVEGYVPVVVEGATTFEVRKKTFLQLVEVAVARAPDPCVLVIDEINRGDVSRIFGELLTYLEPSYRNAVFRLAYSGRATQLPRNLFIIGTFNPFDRSVVELDDAMDRRFDRIALEPSPEKLKEILLKEQAPPELVGKVIECFVALNKMSRHGLGHALFKDVRDDETLRHLWRRKLRFILEKAFRFDDSSLKSAKEKYLTLFSDPTNAGL